MTRFDPAPTLTLSDYLVQEITRKILRGELQPGQRLQEVAIAQQVGVSRGPVREAIRTLQEHGLVTYQPNRGVWITKLTEPDVLNLIEVRVALEGLAARLAAPRLGAEHFRRLTTLVARMYEVAERSTPVELMPLDVEFHRFLSQASGNNHLAHHIGLLSVQARQHYVISHMLIVDAGFVASQHAAMIEVLRAGDPQAAEAAMIAHIRMFGQEYIAHLQEQRRSAQPAEPATQA